MFNIVIYGCLFDDFIHTKVGYLMKINVSKLLIFILYEIKNVCYYRLYSIFCTNLFIIALNNDVRFYYYKKSYA